MIATILLLALGLAAQALSFPVSQRDATERVFLTNCASTQIYADGTTLSLVWSEIQYYSYDAASRRDNPIATATAKVVRGGYITWEGGSVGGPFLDGDFFVSNIAAGAQNLPDFYFAGTGHNNYRTFNCYKDNGRLLNHEDSPTGLLKVDCNSIYYCEDA